MDWLLIILVLQPILKKLFHFIPIPAVKVILTENIEQAVEVMLEKLEVVQQMFNEESKTQKAYFS